MSNFPSEPISSVIWRHRDELVPNSYNPNHVAPAELELLQISILEDGWTQPVVIQATDGPTFDIVDGFHRWTVSGLEALTAKYGGYLPTVLIEVDPVHRQMSTIRHNRARGHHGVVPMADIVRGMMEAGVDKKEIMSRLQMEDIEVERLTDTTILPKKVSDAHEFSMGWTSDLDK